MSRCGDLSEELFGEAAEPPAAPPAGATYCPQVVDCRWILLLVGAAADRRYRGAGRRAPAYGTATAARTDLSRTVTATGHLQAVTTVQVGTQVSGTISDLYADFNSRVKKGQVIARSRSLAAAGPIDAGDGQPGECPGERGKRPGCGHQAPTPPSSPRRRTSSGRSPSSMRRRRSSTARSSWWRRRCRRGANSRPHRRPSIRRSPRSSREVRR